MFMPSKRLACATFIAVCLFTSLALADEAAEAAKRAELYHVATAKTYNMHAHDHARMLGKYAVAAGKPVSADVLREHTAAIRSNVARAQAAYSKLAMAAKNNPDVVKQLAAITKQLARVTKQVNELESDNKVESKLVVSATDAISQDLKATHLASKEIDRALASANAEADQNETFDDPQSSSYYFTGEGHFID